MVYTTKKSILRNLLISILLGVLGGALAVSLFQGMGAQISAVDVRLRLVPAVHGQTEIRLPPFGTATADTHKGPLKLQITVEELSLERTKQFIHNGFSRTELKRDVTSNAKALFTRFIVINLLIAIAGGVLLHVIVVRKHRLTHIGLSGISGAGALLGVLLLAYTTFSPLALENPRLDGLVEGMPWALKIVKEGYVRLDTLGSDMRDASRRMAGIYQQLGNLSNNGSGEDEVRLLIVSDLHNNLIAINTAARLADLFDVSVVVNAGDLTDLGSHYEREVALALKRINCPQVFVTGNHDSPAVVAAARQVPNLHVLNGSVVEVAGIRFLGISDPASQASGVRELLSTEAQKNQARRKLKALLRKANPKPEVIVVHDPEIAAWAAGEVPLVINGHTHTLMVKERHGTVFVNPGTTGASGVRYFLDNDKPAVTALILHLSKSPAPGPVAVDVLKFDAGTGNYSLSHERLKVKR